MKTTSSLLAVFLMSLAMLATPTAYAAECEFSEAVSELSTLQKNIGNRNQLLEELALRKTILNDLTSCFIEETQAKEEALESAVPANPEAKAYQRWLGNQFTETISFYEFKSTQIENVGIQGSKNLARTLLDRREGTDTPLFERTAQFIAWNTNQELFSIARKRLLDITATLEVFDLPIGHELGELLVQAKDSLAAAEEKNQETWETLKVSVNSDDTLPLIKTSLEALAESYEIFFQISEESKKELPL